MARLRRRPLQATAATPLAIVLLRPISMAIATTDPTAITAPAAAAQQTDGTAMAATHNIVAATTITTAMAARAVCTRRPIVF